MLRQLLTARGYEILQSSEGWDVINRARNEQPDLIVMDIKLPDICELDAILLLKKDDQTKDIPIIAVTARVTPGGKANALKSGCAAYIAKPVNIGNLLRTVESFLPSSSRWQPVGNKQATLVWYRPRNSALLDRFGTAPIPQSPAISNRHHDQDLVRSRRVGHRDRDRVEMRE